MRAALDAADAGRLVREALQAPDVTAILRSASAMDVAAAGKAAFPMLDAFVAAGGLPLRQIVGVAPAPAALAGARWHAPPHPVPDERSVAAAQDLLGVAAAAWEDDLIVLLLSGGASSLLALPAAGLTLVDKQETSRRLLAEGAEIHALNAVRKHLSGIKGGRLAAATAARVLTLALSDVVDDDVSAIGSGPAVADQTTFGDALEVLDRHGGRGRYPAAVVAHLERGTRGEIPETPKPGDPRAARWTARVVGSRRTALDGARVAAESLGYAVRVIDRPITGEARVAGPSLVAAAARVLEAGARGGRPPGRVCVLAAGETVVRVTGGGKGGRNQECALAMARTLDALGGDAAAASVGTDGTDGPTDAAGAVVDTTTLARAEAADIGPPERYLSDNNSYVFFDQLGDLIRTGPTRTNVGDLQVILARRAQTARER